ncbi:putative pentachlorophenol 4-monooxygenase [Xylariaceae sp. FL1651]|nr:putative pentachlorophenol 4-monooxygenase [Xylariaceae sp. FL1651]
MTKLYDVVIAGAGPIGLFLACELALSGASVLVLERDVNPSSPWKAIPLGLRGLNTQSVEFFHRRGLLSKLWGPGQRATFFEKTGPKFAGHFAGIFFDGNKLDLKRFKYTLDGPALQPAPTNLEKLQTVLTQRAEELGVEIRRGCAVTDIAAQDAGSVTVEATLAGPGEGAHESRELFRGRWLVGCDGGRSAVRKAAGFEFVGTEPKTTNYALQCELDHPENLKPGFQQSGTGMYTMMSTIPLMAHIYGQFAGTVLFLQEFDNGAYDRSQAATQEHLQGVLERVTGNKDTKITKVYLVNTFTDRTKQTTQYRRGRVLLAGDANHIHPPLGGQGLNLGLGDAMNLGWKLGALIRREAQLQAQAQAQQAATTQPELEKTPEQQLAEADDLALLDTYESERRPIGAWLLDYTRAQVNSLQPDEYGRATYALLRDLIATTDGANYFIERSWGLSLRYVFGDGDDQHPVVGRSVPDFELADGARLGSKMEGARGLLVDFGENAELKALLGEGDPKYEERVDYLALSAKDTCGLSALLVRPDGVVAWAVDEGSEPDVGAAKAALERWFRF